MWISSCKFAQPAAQFLAHLRVERAKRLVQQQHLRLHGERAGQRDALALAAGKLRRKSFGERLELDEFQKFADTGADFLLRRARRFRADAQTEGDVFKNTHVPEQRVVLEGEAGLALAGGNLRHILAVKQNLRVAGVVEIPGRQWCAAAWSCRSRTARAARPVRRTRLSGSRCRAR